MKKWIAGLMVCVVAISPLFRGLFFAFETSAFLAVLAFLSFLYCLVKLRVREPWHFDKLLVILNILLVAAYGLAFIKASYLRDNIQAIIQYAQYGILSIILYDYYHDKKEQFGTLVMLTVTLSGFVNAVIGILGLSGATVFLQETVFGTRVGGTLQYANTAAILYAVCIIFTIILWFQTNKIYYRLILLSMGNVLFLAMWFTGSRGGLLVSFGSILLLFLLQSPGTKWKIFGAVFVMMAPAIMLLQQFSIISKTNEILKYIQLIAFSLCVTVLVGIILELILILFTKIPKIEKGNKLSFALLMVILISILASIILFRNEVISLIPDSITKRFLKISLSENNIYLRLMYDRISLKLISENWLTGLGGGSFASYNYQLQDKFFVVRDAHNHFLQVLVEAGILAGIAFIVIVIKSIWNYIAAFVNEKNNKTKSLFTGFFCAFLGLAIHIVADFDLSFVSIALIFWIMTVMGTVFAAKSKNSRAEGMKKHAFLPPLFFVPVLSALIAINALYTVSGYNEYMAYKYKAVYDYSTAASYFEEAHRLDPLQSDYCLNLSQIYNTFSELNSNPYQQSTWRAKALIYARKSISLNPHFPENLDMLINTLLKSNQSLKAIDYARLLVQYQPLKGRNYGILADTYLQASQEYLKEGKKESAKDLLEKCIRLEIPQNAVPYKPLEAYKKEALSLLDKIN